MKSFLETVHEISKLINQKEEHSLRNYNKNWQVKKVRWTVQAPLLQSIYYIKLKSRLSVRPSAFFVTG